MNSAIILTHSHALNLIIWIVYFLVEFSWNWTFGASIYQLKYDTEPLCGRHLNIPWVVSASVFLRVCFTSLPWPRPYTCALVQQHTQYIFWFSHHYHIYCGISSGQYTSVARKQERQGSTMDTQVQEFW
jgi:hypothetical protein